MNRHRTEIIRLLTLHTILVTITLATSVMAARAQGKGDSARGAMLRISGDVVIAPQERCEAVIVINGNASIAGKVGSVTVINGNVELVANGAVRDVTVINGSATAHNGSTITGDLHLIDATLDRAPGATIGGTIQRDGRFRLFQGFRVFGTLFGIGYVIAVIVAGTIIATIAPTTIRQAGTTLTDNKASTLIAALVIWIGLPAAAFIGITTIIGVPLAIGTLLFLLPTLAFFGYLTSGIRLGDWIIERRKEANEPPPPYRSALAGLGLLVVAGWIPVLGSLVTAVATIGGSGALAIEAWRRLRGNRMKRKEVGTGIQQFQGAT